jgi:hypothetical protein
VSSSCRIWCREAKAKHVEALEATSWRVEQCSNVEEQVGRGDALVGETEQVGHTRRPCPRLQQALQLGMGGNGALDIFEDRNAALQSHRSLPLHPEVAADSPNTCSRLIEVRTQCCHLHYEHPVAMQLN